MIGAWLAGTFDSDRAVARAAQDALQQSFAGQERLQALWKIYRDAILEYVEDAALAQTPQTLSDERTTSPDDSEAKHVRVAGNAILMLRQLLTNLSNENLERSPSVAVALMNNVKLWNYSYHADAFMRRCIYQLLVLCSTKYPSSLPWTELSTALLSKALHIPQLGSNVSFVDALIAVTKVHPEIWTKDYSSKTPVTRRFFQFSKKGSQKGTEVFWLNLDELIRIVPKTVWAPQQSDTGLIDIVACRDLMKSLQEGVSNPEEPRSNVGPAWRTYQRTGFWLMSQLTDKDEVDQLLSEHLLPLIDQHIFQDPGHTQWTVPPSASSQIASETVLGALREVRRETFLEFWTKETEKVIEKAKLSLPETSKDYLKSQNSIIEMSQRLLVLQKVIISAFPSHIESNNSTSESFAVFVHRLIIAAIDILDKRNGKPFGAAALLADEITLLDQKCKFEELDTFLEANLPALLNSPSAESLIRVLFLCRGRPSFHNSLRNSVNQLLQIPDSDQRSRILQEFVSVASLEDLSTNNELRNLVLDQVDVALQGQPSRWAVVSAVLNDRELDLRESQSNTATGEFSNNVQDDILTKIVDALSLDSHSDAAMQGIEVLLSESRPRMRHWSDSFVQKLNTRLLMLSDSPDDQISDHANVLIQKLRSEEVPDKSDTVATSTLDLIRHQLAGSSPLLSMFSLIDLAKATYQSTRAEKKADVAASLLPTNEHWQLALAPFLSESPQSSLAITSPLQGLVYTVEKSAVDRIIPVTRDSEDLSVAFRLALYVVNMASSTDILETVQPDRIRGNIEYLALVLQLINDKITLESSNTLWLNSTQELLEEAADVLAEGRKLILMELGQNGPHGNPRNENDFASFMQEKVLSLQGLSAEAFHYTEALCSILQADTELKEANANGLLRPDMTNELRRSKNMFKSGVLLIASSDLIASSAQGRKLVNELVADATQIKENDLLTFTLKPIFFLNIILSGDPSLLEGIPSQRLVFLIKTLLRILNTDGAGMPSAAESLKLLTSTLPAVRDIYGEHWGSVLSYLAQFWQSSPDLEQELPLLHSSLKLYASLSGLLKLDEVNEDFSESWASSKASLQSGLIEILRAFQNSDRSISQPRQITAELLKRQIIGIEVDAGTKTEAVFPLLTSPEASVQGAAYELLHIAIPKAQEQTSLDVALEGKIAQLPSGLLVSIATPPTEPLSQPSLTSDQTWLDIRRYLLSWNLIFDHFANASYKLREIYATAVKESGHIQTLLDLICTLIHITSPRPVDASKIEIQNFVLETSESLEQEAVWLAIHLYYRSLLHVSALSKDWFLEQKNRIKSPLESWTQKHISPLIVDAALSTVTEWTKTQDPEDRPVKVKASLRGSELTASIAVDEESGPSHEISLTVTLPGAYPLEPATVTGRSRVGVSEKNWQSWLRTIQIIIFSTGSLIEGLVAFRRNVQANLRGQTECAICYSIIGTDMSTPNKKCATCKNAFHSLCLYRWFRSSNSSSCPLCRNNFHYA